MGDKPGAGAALRELIAYAEEHLPGGCYVTVTVSRRGFAVTYGTPGAEGDASVFCDDPAEQFVLCVDSAVEYVREREEGGDDED